MALPVAVQLYTLREEMKVDMRATLEKVKALGYDGVEFAGLFGKTGEEVRDMCQEIGLVPLSAHVPYVDMVEDITILETYKTIGCKYVVVPYLKEEHRPGTDAFAEVIENIKKIGAAANELGLTLLYHNHDFEFIKLDGKYAGYVRVMEYAEIAPGESFGLQVPEKWQTDYFHAKLGDNAAVKAGVIELSKDGKIWSKLNSSNHGENMEKPLSVADGWKFARYRNVSNRKVRVKINQFKFDIRPVASATEELIDELLK